MAFFRRTSPADHGPAIPPTPDASTSAADATSTGRPSTGVSPLAALPAPKTERLDRNKLSIIAAFAGMGVIAMVVFMQPSAPNSAATRVDAPTPQSGTYLDQPMRSTVPPGGASSTEGNVAIGSTGSSFAGTTPGASGPSYDASGATASPRGTPNSGANLAPGYAPLPSSPDPYAPADEGQASATSRPPTLAELRAAAYRRALDAPPTGEEPASERAPLPGAVAQGTARSVTAEGDAAALTAGEREVGAAAATAATGVKRADHFMQTAAIASNQRTVQALTVQAAPGPYSVQAGTVIPAVLMTEINSDLPGECLAQITRDVYDSRAQHFVLIPRGAKLLCKYDDQLTTGQSRLLVAWTRILLPDGRSISLPGLPATDAAGARGVSDQVDRHAKKTFGTAAALSIISAGAQLAMPRSGNVFSAPSTGQVMAGALGQELNQVAVEMLRRDLSNRQTIRIRQGVEFNVFLNTDLTFPGPYATTRADGAVAATPTTAVDRFGRVVPSVPRER